MSNGTDVAPIRSILHATDFTVASELAFAHALKIALAGKTKLYLVHADPDSVDEVDWSAFPGVRRTLAGWRVLPEAARCRMWATSSGSIWPRSARLIATPSGRSSGL
jgi:hypothetical protein